MSGPLRPRCQREVPTKRWNHYPPYEELAHNVATPNAMWDSGA